MKRPQPTFGSITRAIRRHSSRLKAVARRERRFHLRRTVFGMAQFSGGFLAGYAVAVLLNQTVGLSWEGFALGPLAGALLAGIIRTTGAGPLRGLGWGCAIGTGYLLLCQRVGWFGPMGATVTAATLIVPFPVLGGMIAWSHQRWDEDHLQI